MTYISDCCHAEAVEDTLEQWVNYLTSPNHYLQQDVVMYGRCSSCHDIGMFQEEKEE